MANFILHNEGRYNIFSTISDSFYFESHLTLKQLKEWYKENFGSEGESNLIRRLNRAHIKGTSSYNDNSLEDVLSCNRCGKDETFMPIDECIRKFL